MPRSKKQKAFSRALLKKRLLVLISLLLVMSAVGYVGLKLYPPFKSLADTGVTPNPPFAYTCGFNVMIEIDTSTSRKGAQQVNLDKQHIQAFMNAFNGTDTLFSFTVSSRDDLWIPYTSDKTKIVNAMNTLPSQGSTDINLNVLTGQIGYRPSKQTIIMIFTDGGDPDKYEEDYSGPSNQLKASGARIIAFILPGQKGSISDIQKMTGPNIDTGNILTSDIVHNSDYASLTAQLKQFATVDSCNPPPPSPTPSGPAGPSGPGPGPGNGNDNGGTGTGTNGQGGGGSSAMTEAEKPNPLPSTASQGDRTEQPKVEASPFFDGKLFAAGSDTNDSLAKDKTVGIGGLRIGYGWLVLIGLAALVAATYFFWWRRLAPKDQLNLKRKLLLKK